MPKFSVCFAISSAAPLRCVQVPLGVHAAKLRTHLSKHLQHNINVVSSSMCGAMQCNLRAAEGVNSKGPLMASMLPQRRLGAAGRPSRAPARLQPVLRSCNGQECSTSQAACSCGIVIVDHGSRRKASNDMLLEFCELYRTTTDWRIVEPAHMEIAEPSIQQAIERCVQQGAKHVVVAPYFLSRGRHIQEDIPALVAAAQQQHPDITCQIAEPIGIDPLMVQLISNRVQVALTSSCPGASTAAEAAADETAGQPAAVAAAAVLP